MDADLVSAGVSTKQRQQQLRKTMPYPVTKYDSKIKKPPVAMPKTSVSQLQARAKAGQDCERGSGVDGASGNAPRNIFRARTQWDE